MSYNYEWHHALNDYNKIESGEFKHWMYDALTCKNEVPRLARLFKAEREDKLPKIHQQCSMQAPVELKENFLTCCIGTKCKECPHLKALELKLSGDELDNAKAWTCTVHILKQPTRSIDSSEGFILTEDDKMFWQNVYKSMSSDEGTEYDDRDAREETDTGP